MSSNSFTPPHAVPSTSGYKNTPPTKEADDDSGMSKYVPLSRVRPPVNKSSPISTPPPEKTTKPKTPQPKKTVEPTSSPQENNTLSRHSPGHPPPSTVMKQTKSTTQRKPMTNGHAMTPPKAPAKFRTNRESMISFTPSAPERLVSGKKSSWQRPSKHEISTKYHTSSSEGGEPNVPVFDLKWKVTTSGAGMGELRKPVDTCILPNDEIAITEPKNSRVQIFNRTGKPVAIIGKDKESEDKKSEDKRSEDKRSDLLTPTCMDLNYTKKMLFVSDSNQIHCIDLLTHESVANFPLYDKVDIHGLCSDKNGDLIITNLGPKAGVMIYDINAQKVKMELHPKTERLQRPAYVQTCPITGRIYVSDSESHCVHVFDKFGRFIKAFGNKRGNTNNHLTWPSGIATNRFGEVMVADRSNHRIACFDGDGKFKYHAVTSAHGLYDPVGLALYDTTLAVTTHTTDYKKDTYTLKLFQGQE